MDREKIFAEDSEFPQEGLMYDCVKIEESGGLLMSIQ
jgi:hypothetical protein